MDATTTFVADVTVALIAASIAGAVARFVRITPVIGYIAAGIAIGPFTPGYVAHGGSLSGLAQLGLIFLLFSLGLGFALSDLLEAGVAAIVGNAAAMGLVAVAVWFVALRTGNVHPITLALTFTISSTAVGAALLQTLGQLGKRTGRVALSLLITQDLIAVTILVVISTPAGQLSITGVAFPLLRAIVFVAAALVLGATILHRLFIVTLHRAGTELLVVIFSAVALGAAWLGHAAGLTFEFGAFVAGAVTSEAAGSRMVQNIVRPFRELFVMLFFVSMGTLVDVSSVLLNWRIVAGVAVVAIVVRCAFWLGVGRVAGLGGAGAATLAIALLPMGEFNIVLGNASYAAGRLDRSEIALLVGTAMISVIVSALLARLGEKHLRRLDRVEVPLHTVPPSAQVVVIGYGRVGQTAAAMLMPHNIGVAVIEHDAGLIKLAQAHGVQAVYGDGGDPHVLEHAVSPDTRVVLTTIPDSSVNAAVVRWLRARNSGAVIARAQRAADIARLLDAGAQTALVPEIEGARAFGLAVLEALRKDDVLPEPQE